MAWLKRGASASELLSGIRRARHGIPCRVPRIGGASPMAAVMIGVDPHKASHTAVVMNAAEEELGELRVRACADARLRRVEAPSLSPGRPGD